jgi:hypothetical protein
MEEDGGRRLPVKTTESKLGKQRGTGSNHRTSNRTKYRTPETSRDIQR